MSNQKLVSNGMQDKEILHKFIAEAEPLLLQSKNNEETLTNIYRRAAKELETYYDDYSMICSRLSRVFPKEQSRLIRKVLDTKYKRGYGSEILESDLPITEVEELFLSLKEALEGLLKVTNRVVDKIRASPAIQNKIHNNIELTDSEKEEFALCLEYQKTIFSAFGTMAELKKYIESVRSMSLEVKLIQDEFDNRLKLDEYKRVIVKLYDLVYRYRKIGKVWHKSAKWIKQVVEDPELEKIIEQADKCPQCNFEWAAMFNKQAKRIEKGLEPKLPKGFTIDWEA
jgi:hypothetical protein